MKRKRHFSKTSFVTSMQCDPATYDPKQADIEPLGDCLRALGEGQTLGDFSLTVVTRQDFARDRPRVHQRRWESLRRELQPAQCVFRHDPKQLQAQAAQAISAQLKLCRSLVPVHDSPWRDQE